MTQTFTGVRTFTLTDAKYIASKVATDLKRIQRFYGFPSNNQIDDFETELAIYLKYGFLDSVTYGFQKNDQWIEPMVKYNAQELSGYASKDDDPGLIKPNADISGAKFCSFLTYSTAWWLTTNSEQNEFKKLLPINRTTGSEPGFNGYLSRDLTYSSGGQSLNRSSLKSY